MVWDRQPTERTWTSGFCQSPRISSTLIAKTLGPNPDYFTNNFDSSEAASWPLEGGSEVFLASDFIPQLGRQLYNALNFRTKNPDRPHLLLRQDVNHLWFSPNRLWQTPGWLQLSEHLVSCLMPRAPVFGWTSTPTTRCFEATRYPSNPHSTKWPSTELRNQAFRILNWKL